MRRESDPAVDIVTLDALDVEIDEPVEDQPTFEGNAVLKARHYAQASGMTCLADDSGLEVDALGGEPGVRSARYAGVAGGRDVADPANNALLLERLGEMPTEQRTARFVCVMALAEPSGEVLATERGTIEGRIIGPNEASRGKNGFGYDPLFVVPELGKTSAELSAEHKNRISHRGAASRLMYERLREIAST